MNNGLVPYLILLAIIPIADVVATGFFVRLFWRSAGRGQPRDAEGEEVLPKPRPASFVTRLLGGRSWLLAMLAGSFAIITLVFMLIGYLAVRRLLGAEPFAAGAILTIFGLIALGLIPPFFAIAFDRTRRKRGGRPPPFGDGD